MEMEFWASRVHSAKSFSAVQSDHLNNSDGTRDDDMRALFPCPYCYVDVEVPAICLHLQEEHCFDLKNAVCPICAANLGKDAVGHFTSQHAHLVKLRKKSQKSGNNSTVPGKDMRALRSYHGLQRVNGKGNMHENLPDPLLSSFISSMPLLDPEGEIDADMSCKSDSTSANATSTKSAVLDEAQEQDYRERTLRAAFAQQLILSTIF